MPLKVGNTNIIRLYYKTEDNEIIEVKHLKDEDNVDIHKRVKVTFITNVTPIYDYIRTWGVELVTPEPLPSEYLPFVEGWTDIEHSQIPNVSFPTLAPQENTEYYIVWSGGGEPVIYEVSELESEIELLGEIDFDSIRLLDLTSEAAIKGEVTYTTYGALLRELTLEANQNILGDIVYEIGKSTLEEIFLESNQSIVGDIVYEIGKSTLEEIFLEAEQEVSGDIVYEIGKGILESYLLEASASVESEINFNSIQTQGTTIQLTNVTDIIGIISFELGQGIFKQMSLEERMEISGDIVYEIGKRILNEITILTEVITSSGDIIFSSIQTQGIDYSLLSENQITGEIILEVGKYVLQQYLLNSQLTITGNIDFITGQSEFKQYTLSSLGELNGEVDYEFQKRIKTEYSLISETNILGNIVLELGHRIITNYLLEADIDIESEINFIIDKLQGVTYNLTSNLSLTSLINYTNLKRLITNYSLTSSTETSGEISYDKIKSFEVVWKRQWDNSIIKTDYVLYGGSATFPTNAQINYGSGYEADGYAGTYTNVTSNRTITIKRKSTAPPTAKPTISGTPTCIDKFGTKYLRIKIKNNDALAATIRINGNNVGTVNAGQTGTIDFLYSLPGQYSVSVTATASGKDESSAATKFGNILFCVAQE